MVDGTLKFMISQQTRSNATARKQRINAAAIGYRLLAIGYARSAPAIGYLFL
jgi:hypothetical protein